MLEISEVEFKDTKSKLIRIFKDETMPSSLKPLTQIMSTEHIVRLLSEMTPLTTLADEIGPIRVLEYLDKIERIEDPPLADLAKAIGKDKVARFLYYADSHDELNQYTCPNSIQGTSGAVLLKPDLQCLCASDKKLPLIFHQMMIKIVSKKRLHINLSLAVNIGYMMNKAG